MWIKTIEGKLVNASNVEEFTIITPHDSSRNQYILRACHSGDNFVDMVHGSTKDVCEMAMKEIEHGILTGAILVDLLSTSY